ncbi:MULTISPECIES: hypothetical protein [unclassified Salinicola]|uniref:hypothetical protein n=1 Tax=unclassified Salinicola TaxID=2634022 RepID=UPI0004E75438|nr:MULTISPECIES: hypothetical protein [unclassified Salinicola]KFF47526.1 hypothetical protein GY26_20325 [Gammaproteobacteria bacterium MFB021]MCE3027061.1 hypothetical protein [Salinicola sp. DM10]WIX32226.1 hypothetical protein QO259_15640 [Salinicola sp. JS01]
MSSEQTPLAQYIERLRAEEIDIEAMDEQAARLRQDHLEFVLVVAADEPAFFQLMLPGVWQAAASTNRLRLLETANDVMNTIKAAKLVVHQEAVHVSVEQFVSGPEQGAALIPGLMELLKSAVAEFQERLGMGEAPRIH